MLTVEEKKIIDAYPTNERIMLKDFLKDFVMQNPSNFPYSSTILSEVRVPRDSNDGFHKVSGLFNEDALDRSFSYFGRDHVADLSGCCITINQVHFTLLICAIYAYYPKECYMMLSKNRNGKLFYLFETGNDYDIIIDDDLKFIMRFKCNLIIPVTETIFRSYNDDLESISNELAHNHDLIKIGKETSNLTYRLLTIIAYAVNRDTMETSSEGVSDCSIFSDRTIPSEFHKEKKSAISDFHTHQPQIENDMMSKSIVC